MKAIRRIISLTAVIALLVSMASCSLLEKKANFTKKVTADNVEVTIRDDMTEVDEIKNDDNYITGYKWNGYGVNFTKIEANDASLIKLSCESGDTLLKKVGETGKNASDIKKFGDHSYIELTDTTNKQELFSIVYLVEAGYEYYLFEFYTLPKNGDKYRSEYETIVSSASLITEPAKTVEASILGVVMTLDGDAFEQSSGTWMCGRYGVSVMNTNMNSSVATPLKFAQLMIAQDLKTADGLIPEIKTTDGGVPYFEAKAEELYAIHYIKDINGTLYYIMLYTLVPTDEQLIPEFNTIVDNAHAA